MSKPFNLNNGNIYNVLYQKLKVDYITKCEIYPLCSSQNVQLIPYIISPLLYEIVKLSEVFPNMNMLNIRYHRGTESILVNIS